MVKPPLRPNPEREKPANSVRGEVRIKGTDTPVSNVIAQAYAFSAESSGGSGGQLSLGSALVERGRFEIRYTDDLIAALKGNRPSIRVKVVGPDASRPLAEPASQTLAGCGEPWASAICPSPSRCTRSSAG